MATYPSPTLQDLTVNGAASLANVSSAAATITGGTIDGTPIGATTPAAVHATTINSTGAATLASVSTANATLTGGTVDGVTIGGTTPEPATITNLTVSGTVSGTGITNLLAPYPTSSTLAASSGSALIGFLQSGPSAISRTEQSKLQDVVNVKDFGAACDGSTDDTIAFQNALNDLSAASGGVLTLPAGRIKLGAITLPANVSIRGAGKYSTWIVPAGAQTCFTLASTGAQIQQTYSDFGIDCGSTASVNGFKFTNCLNVGLYRIAFKGCVSNFEIDQGYYYDIDGCDSIGTATNKAGSCKIWSSDDTKYVFQVGLRRYTINNIGNGVQGPAVYVRRGVAVQLHQVNCNDANAGGAIDYILIENDCQGCKIQQSGCGASNHGILIQTGAGVAVSPSFIDVVSCDFDQPNTAGISIGNGYNIAVIGGNITSSGVGTTGCGILVSHATAVRICDAVINGFNVANGTGIYVDGTGGTSYVQLRNNHIESCYFAFVMANSPTYISASGNVLRNCTNKLNGSVVGTGNVFSSNSGFNPVTVTTPAFPATGVFVTNTTGTRCTIYVSGGTISTVYINGGSGGIVASSLSYDLEPGETTAISYTGSPSWVWHGH